MTDIPLENTEEMTPETATPKLETPAAEAPVDGPKEIEDKKETTLPSAPQGMKLDYGNSEVIKIKLLESIQNIGIRQLKVLEAMATQQGVNLNAIK